ncbi:transposase [Pseudoxanthomonas sp. UTMC 1351]|uniref:REP-associated tyrosine transposase n=1 Tax=Pseudoxanthomonas sp. UTMC 1351 TaxID=2695853 RepID=UPI0034CE6A2A
MVWKLASPSGHAALRRGRFSSAGQIYHVTVVTHGRTPVFKQYDVAVAAARCLHRQSDLNGSRLLAWVLMPDHTHWLLQLGQLESLSHAVARLKSATARCANRARGQEGPLCSRSFHDHALRRDEDVQKVARYLIANPLRAGLVERIGDYPFWDAVWL